MVSKTRSRNTRKDIGMCSLAGLSVSVSSQHLQARAKPGSGLGRLNSLCVDSRGLGGPKALLSPHFGVDGSCVALKRLDVKCVMRWVDLFRWVDRKSIGGSFPDVAVRVDVTL